MCTITVLTLLPLMALGGVVQRGPQRQPRDAQGGEIHLGAARKII